jgi:carboxyl-terminal processing protease
MITKRFYQHKTGLLMFSLAVIFFISSCKKSDPLEPSPTGDTTVTPGVGTRPELTKDSLFLYAKQVYYWNDALPTYEDFKPRSYNTSPTDLENYEAELFAITQFKINPATNKPYEYSTIDPTSPKYSYINDITTNNSAQSSVRKEKASVELDGSGFDLGFFWFKPYGTSSDFSFYVMGVYPNSPAAKAGLTRGAIINKVNGQAVGTNYSSQYLLVYNIVDQDPASVTISGVKADGTPFNDLVLTKVKYKTNSVFKTKTITAGTKKIGYLALANFSDLTKVAQPVLDSAFTKFAADGVTDLIIDLRYNGGGFVNTAEYLINLIAPSTASGTMFKEYYNPLMQQNKATILVNQPLLDENDKTQYQNGKLVTYADIDYSPEENTITFSKKGNLTSVANVVFLVSGNTASASELVINGLKPHVNVKLVGTQTYGKPVGFFPIRLENKYDVYMSMFETKNSKDEGGYYSGFTPDVIDKNTSALYEDATHDFGDVNESYTKNAIQLLAPGTVATSSNAVMSIRGKKSAVASSLGLLKDAKGLNNFVGMIETRHKLKK